MSASSTTTSLVVPACGALIAVEHHRRSLDVLTPTEAARELKVPRKTVVALCARGDIPGARKVGRHWRIPAVGLLAMFDLSSVGKEQERGHLQSREEPVAVRIWHRGKRQDWIVNGIKKDAEASRFSDFCVERYKPHAKAHLRATTWNVRRYQLADLIEHFGDIKLTAITPLDVERYKERRTAEGVKPISINNELAVLQAVMSYARHLRVPVADLDLIGLPVRKKSRWIVWSEEDVRRLMDQCARLSPELVPVVVFLANTGCRRGEGLALTWECVDLNQRSGSSPARNGAEERPAPRDPDLGRPP